MVVAAAQGSWVWDGEGTPFLDFSSQLVNTNIGHQHPRVVAAIREQAERLCTIAPQHVNDARSEAARLITERAPGDHLNHVFFTNGGTDAIENAVRMARLHTGRHKVLARYRSYHGHTQVSINLTGDPRRWANESGEGVVHFFGPFLYRSHFHATTEQEECDRALQHLQETIELEGPSTIAAIVLETIPGTAGIMVPPERYLAGVRDLCDQYGIMWIADEVMAGFGRSGAWFSVDHFKGSDGAPVLPDLMTFAKGVNSGYVPLGGVIISERIAQTFDQRPFPGGLTYSGHPLACASAVASIGIFKEEGIVEHARSLGSDVIGPGQRDLATRHPSVGEVRGLGAFWALELVRDRSTREPLVPFNAGGADAKPMNDFGAACKERGLWPFIHINRTHVEPPCTTTADEVRTGLAILDEALTVADAFYTGPDA
jgi:taurine--2-oxoglutarate transaminase